MTARLAALRRYLAMDRPAGSLPELDGLRALAIVLVLFRHAVVPFRPADGALLPIGGWDAATPFVNGWMGVDLFFVLSGFLITHHVCRRYGGVLDRRSWGDYLLRRALRIVPAYYAMIAVVAAGLVPFYAVDSRDLGRSVGSHLLFMQDYLGSDLLVVFWSLGVEEKFYLLAPLVLAGVLAVRRTAIQYALVVAVALLPMLFRWIVARETPAGIAYPMYFQLFRSPFHLGFDGLAMGMLCALVYRYRACWPLLRDRRCSDTIFWLGAAAVAALLVATPLFDAIGFFDEVPLGLVLAVGMSGMLLGLTLGGGPRAWFRGRALFVVSKLSYTLYLVHYALIPAATALADAAFGEPSSPLARFAVFLPIYLVLSFVGAALLHYLVEKPFLVLRDSGISVRVPTTRAVSAPLGRPAS
jgi:peptidoglycan/LPS O-acetylase OafA/YrhL